MTQETQLPATAGLPERRKRRLLNQMAQRLSVQHYRVAQARLQAQLDGAEMRGSDQALLATWQRELDGGGLDRADACSH